MSSKSEQPSRSFVDSVYTAIPSLIMKASDLFGWPRTSRVTSPDREQEPTEHTVPHVNLPIRSGRRSAEATMTPSSMGSSPTNDTVTFADPLGHEEAQSSQAQGSDEAPSSLTMSGANGTKILPADDHIQDQTRGDGAEHSEGGLPKPGNPTDAGSYSTSRGRPFMPHGGASSPMIEDQATAEQEKRTALHASMEAAKRAMNSKDDHLSADVGPTPTNPPEATSFCGGGQSTQATVAEEMARMNARRAREAKEPTCGSKSDPPEKPTVSCASNLKDTVRDGEQRATIEKYQARLRQLDREMQELRKSRNSQASTRPQTDRSYVTVYGGKVDFNDCNFSS